MFLIVTRNFPPDIGGIQNLMAGLSESLLEHGPVKVFADEFLNSKQFAKLVNEILKSGGKTLMFATFDSNNQRGYLTVKLR